MSLEEYKRILSGCFTLMLMAVLGGLGAGIVVIYLVLKG